MIIAHLLIVAAHVATSHAATSHVVTAQSDTAPVNQPPDSTYSSAALAKIVEMASRTNRRVPPALAGYGAMIESELALLLNTPTGPDGAGAGTAAATTESASQVEQLELRVTWDRAGGFDQHVVGYRARQLGPMVSALTIVPRPWTAPMLYGNRMSLVFGGPPSFRSADSTRRQLPTVHPFADDREQFYRFAGGDTVATIRVGTRDLRIVRISVEPQGRHRDVMLFAGEVLIDGATGAIIRMRGRIKLGMPKGLWPVRRALRAVAQVQEVAYIDFENSEHTGQLWLPHKQRLEYQVMTGLTEARATIRVQSVWRDMQIALRADTSAATADTLGAAQYSFQMISPDSASRWSDWRSELGAVTADASAREFDDVAPPEFRPTGPPQWRWQARGFGDLVRLNRVEGLFLGAAGLLDLRRASPGLSVRAFGGWAFSAGTAKGGVEAFRVRGPWVASLRAERHLASTNDFSQSLGGGGGGVIGGLFGREGVDWVDRRVLSLSGTKEFGTKHARLIRAEAAYASDHGFSHELKTGVFGGDFRPNRPVDPGQYLRSRLQLEVGRNVLNSPLVSGFGATVLYERGDRGLRWQRAQLQSLAQRMFGRVVLAGRADAALAIGSALPTQQLLEIGAAEGLPGFDYKAFAGDQAVVVRSTVGYLLPVWESPIRLARLVLPAIAPQLQAGVFGGRVNAGPRTSARLDQLDWVTSDGWRGSFDLRVRFFGGAFSAGVARSFDHVGGWKLQFGFGGSL